jgi:hypothetical protein
MTLSLFLMTVESFETFVAEMLKLQWIEMPSTMSLMGEARNATFVGASTGSFVGICLLARTL